MRTFKKCNFFIFPKQEYLRKLPNFVFFDTKGVDEGLKSRLPEAYKKFWNEWQAREETPVHYIPEPGKLKRDKWGEILPVQNCPIPILYPEEHHNGIWGGEGVLKGYKKKGRFTMEIPKYWMPSLKKSILYSEILDKHMEVVVTLRTLQLIDKHFGFDYYLLKTPACDLKSLLALKLKREMLLSLARMDFYPDNPDMQTEIIEKYEEFIVPEEEAAWYGLTLPEAMRKLDLIERAALPPIQPLKIKFRKELIEQLKKGEVSADETQSPDGEPGPSRFSNLLSRINPFPQRASE